MNEETDDSSDSEWIPCSIKTGYVYFSLFLLRLTHFDIVALYSRSLFGFLSIIRTRFAQSLNRVQESQEARTKSCYIK